MNNCLSCGKETKNNKFCSLKCRNKHTNEKNKGRRKMRTCIRCGNQKEGGWSAPDSFLCKDCKEKDEQAKYEKNPKTCPKCGLEVPFKMRMGIFCSRKCANGREHTNEWNKKISTGVKIFAKEHPERLVRLYGKDNPNYIDGISSSEYDKNFTKTFRKRVKERDGYKCALCGKSELEQILIGYLTDRKIIQKLSVHHIDYDKKNTVFENCITLCTSCHGRTNMPKNRKRWTKVFIAIVDSTLETHK